MPVSYFGYLIQSDYILTNNYDFFNTFPALILSLLIFSPTHSIFLLFLAKCTSLPIGYLLVFIANIYIVFLFL